MLQTRTSDQYTTIQKNRALALAAISQAVYLVNQIARKGNCDNEDFQTCIQSLFVPMPDCLASHSIQIMYGDHRSLHTGLRITGLLLSGENMEWGKALLTYSASAMALDKRLAKHPNTLDKLGEHMQRIRRQSEYFGDVTHDNILAAIAHAYGETISQLKPRIIVHGKSEYLSQSQHTHKVRALLLAAIRAAHLWHACKGSHIQLLFRRKQLAGLCLHLRNA